MAKHFGTFGSLYQSTLKTTQDISQKAKIPLGVIASLFQVARTLFRVRRPEGVHGWTFQGRTVCCPLLLEQGGGKVMLQGPCLEEYLVGTLQ